MKKVFITIILLLILVSCASSKKAAGNSTVAVQDHTEYVTKETKDTASVKDSIYVLDSIFIKEKGDTVYYYKTNIKYKYKTEYKYINKADTIFIQDSIPYPVIKYEEVVTNKLTWLQKTLMYLGIVTFIALLGVAIIKCIKLYLKK